MEPGFNDVVRPQNTGYCSYPRKYSPKWYVVRQDICRIYFPVTQLEMELDRKIKEICSRVESDILVSRDQAKISLKD